MQREQISAVICFSVRYDHCEIEFLGQLTSAHTTLKLDLSRGHLKFSSIPAHQLFVNLPSCAI